MQEKKTQRSDIHNSLAGAALTVPMDMKAARKRTKAETLKFMMMFSKEFELGENGAAAVGSS